MVTADVLVTCSAAAANSEGVTGRQHAAGHSVTQQKWLSDTALFLDFCDTFLDYNNVTTNFNSTPIAIADFGSDSD